MAQSRSNQKAAYALETTHTAQSAEFFGIFGSNANPKWFEWLMQYAGTYLFTIALLLSFIKLGILSYHFIKSPNKTFNQQGSLAWTVFQTALVGVALVGALVAAPVFTVITPILFVTSMALDTLRNLGLFFWNVGKLALLRFSIRKQLNDPEDYLTKIKYEALKKQYVGKLIEHGIGAVIGTILTAAAAIIFLFPQIGLGAIGAAGLAIGGVKITVAAIAGIGAAGAFAIPLLPTLYRFTKWSISAIGNKIKNGIGFIKSQLTTKHEEKSAIDHKIEDKPEQQSLIQDQIVSPIQQPEFKIDTEVKLNAAIDHQLAFNAFSLHSRFRKTIIDHIDDKELATHALQKMVNEKISILVAELKKSQTNGYQYFTEKQRPKREQKLHALLLIKEQLDNISLEDREIFLDSYKDSFKNFATIKEHFSATYTFDTLIKHIESSLPGVKKSFFLEQSDTTNIIEAFKIYAEKFPLNDEERLELQ